FSLVFFAAQRRVTGSPRRGMSYGFWVQTPSPLLLDARANAIETNSDAAQTNTNPPTQPAK
ncbi:hypothetical protein, partial [Cupriavidus sp. CuC1]|uniref:hypothetical protein n=1 Tax=Cupriavidus sp. CuC1 TaxID=3373131 RepID=UPI0037D2A5A5